MAIEAHVLPSTTQQILNRLRSTDRLHPRLRATDVVAAAAGAPDEAEAIIGQVQDEITRSLEQLAPNASLAEARTVLGSLARTVDHGGRLHAALTHAFEIMRPTTREKPLAALPNPYENSIQNRRELTIMQETLNAVDRALDRQQRIATQRAYRLEADPFHNNPRGMRHFLADLRSRADMMDMLTTAKARLPALYENMRNLNDTLHDDSNIELTAQQREVLETLATAFVAELYGRARGALQNSMSTQERTYHLHQHVDSAMAQLDVHREPLRFSTSWLSDEHNSHIHELLRELPSNLDQRISSLNHHANLIDFALIRLVRGMAYPRETTHMEVNADAQATYDAEISRNPILNYPVTIASAGIGIFLHLNPHLHPIASVRPVLATRKYLAAVFAFTVNRHRVTSTIYKMMARRRIASEIPKPLLPSQTLLKALKQE